MIRINENYLKLQSSYLFSEIGKRTRAFQSAHPDREIIRLGIGDVTHALPPACIAIFVNIFVAETLPLVLTCSFAVIAASGPFTSHGTNMANC